MITELNADEPYSYIILGGILHSSFVEWVLSVPGKFQQVCNYTIILTDIAKVQDSTFDARLLRAGLKKKSFLAIFTFVTEEKTQFQAFSWKLCLEQKLQRRRCDVCRDFLYPDWVIEPFCCHFDRKSSIDFVRKSGPIPISCLVENSCHGGGRVGIWEPESYHWIVVDIVDIFTHCFGEAVGLLVFILLMEEILHHLGCLKPFKQWDKQPVNWWMILSINSMYSCAVCMLR